MHYLHTGTKYMKTAFPNWAETEKVEPKVPSFTPAAVRSVAHGCDPSRLRSIHPIIVTDPHQSGSSHRRSR